MQEALCRPSGTTLDIVHAEDGPPITQRTSGLGFSPKFGALIMTLPGPGIGGLALVVFGLIAATAGRIWVGHRVDFSRAAQPHGRLRSHRRGRRSYCKIGEFALGGIGTATFGAIILYHLLRPRR